ncbi:MAG: recombinase family protein, partial [Sphingomonadales bacterium]
VVVVYKVDRLTRSLADFAKIVETFDGHGVSFVSVTQQFNTTSSMGRLTLNVLLSFAQFEREVTGERIRDKLAASKKKGMWMGGSVPLGYAAKDRTLVILEPEAESVRTLYRLYLKHRCVRGVRDEAERLGLRSKTGGVIEAGAFYTLLKNPVYIGRIKHKEKTYPGLHPPIVDQKTWDQVQQLLEQNRVDRKNGKHAKHPSLLVGKVFDDAGHPFTPSHAVKNGKRYRYYIERGDLPSPPGRRLRRKRIAASELEGLVVRALQEFLRSPPRVVETLSLGQASPEEIRRATAAAAHVAEQIQPEMEEGRELIESLVTKVTISETELQLGLNRGMLETTFGVRRPASRSEKAPHLVVPARLKRRGIELKFVIEGSSEASTQPDPALIKAVVKARRWWEMLLSGDAATLNEVAQRENTSAPYVRRLLEVAFLAPDITAAILDGRQPINLTAETLTRCEDIPERWDAQRRQFGFVRNQSFGLA